MNVPVIQGIYARSVKMHANQLKEAIKEIKKKVKSHMKEIKWETATMTTFRKDSRRLISRVQEYPYRVIFLTSYGQPTGVLVGPGLTSEPANQMQTLVKDAMSLVSSSWYPERPADLRHVYRHQNLAGALLNQQACVSVFGKDFKIPEREPFEYPAMSKELKLSRRE